MEPLNYWCSQRVGPGSPEPVQGRLKSPLPRVTEGLQKDPTKKLWLDRDDYPVQVTPGGDILIIDTPYRTCDI